MGDLNIAASAQDCHPSIQYDQLYSPREKQLLAQLLADYPDAYRRLHPEAQGECYTCWEERTSARDFNRVGPRLCLCVFRCTCDGGGLYGMGF